MPSRAEVRAEPPREPRAPRAPLAVDSSGTAAGGPSWRPWLERACRAGALLLVAWLLWASLRPPAARGAERADAPAGAGDAVRDTVLARWTARPPASAWTRLGALPDPRTRDWLAALAAAGVPIAWGGDS